MPFAQPAASSCLSSHNFLKHGTVSHASRNGGGTTQDRTPGHLFGVCTDFLVCPLSVGGLVFWETPLCVCRVAGRKARGCRPIRLGAPAGRTPQTRLGFPGPGPLRL